MMAVTVVLLSSCKKEDQGITADSQTTEDYYKAQLEKMVGLKVIDEEKNKLSGADGFSNKSYGFVTYEEAYLFFSELTSMVDVKTTDTLYLESIKEDNFPAALTNYDTENQTNTVTVQYNPLYANNQVAVANTFGTASLAVSYRVDISITYGYFMQGANRVYHTWSVTTNNPSQFQASFSGLGTVIPGPYDGVTAGHNGSGTVKGRMEGTATVGGTTSSFFINFSGSYSLSAPTIPRTSLPASIVMTSTLSASSS